MELMVEILLWACVVLESGVYSVSLPEITDAKFIEQCVWEHNKARSNVNPSATDMLHMTWDEALAITARAWAKHCVFEHNIYLEDVHRVHPTFPSVGENIWIGYPPSYFDVSRAMKSWVDEKQDYSYDSNYCSNVCGHYTQVVWASSYKVGCAVHLCPNGIKKTKFGNTESVIFVCNYATAGNMNGQRPYQTGGATCSGCKDTCQENLCRSQERESQRSYNWSPDWDTSGSNYVAVLVARPIALICTFIAAYAVRYFYPDVFCYE